MTYSSIDFTMAARAVGVENGALFLVCPDVFVARLSDATKRHARFLEDAFPQVGHRKMLESVAKAAGFPNWHAFHSLLDKVATDYAPPDSGSRKVAPRSMFEAFVSALPLLISIGVDITPTTEQLTGLTGLIARLSRDLGEQHKVETAIAKLHGADTWSELLARKTEDSAAPLYRFHVYEDGSGRFMWSPACTNLVEELDGLWQHYEERAKSDQAKARSHVATLLKKRPDFLEGWLAQATMEEREGRDEIAGPLFEQGVDRALTLIPKGFKGEISWGYLDNRPYHRLLYNYMRWQVRQGDIAAAIKLARRQLRQNPSDNLGVRYDLPLFLAIAEERDATLKAMAHIQKKDERTDGHILLILAISMLLLGDIKEGQVFFLRALFDLPALRPFLLTQQLPADFQGNRRWHHGVIPDFDTLWFHYESARIWREDTAFDLMFRAMLQNADVMRAERESQALYEKTVDSLRFPSCQSWADFASQTAVALVERNGEVWASNLR